MRIRDIPTLLFIIMAICTAFNRSVQAQIVDPIEDYLQMFVPDRYEYGISYKNTYRATFDINNDGKNEVSIGTQYDYSGSKEIYWAVYELSKSGGYKRISPTTSDIPINLLTAFLGNIEEYSKEGVLEIRDSLRGGEYGRTVIGFSTVNLYSLNHGVLIKTKLSPLNLRDSNDKSFYEKYFGKKRKSRTIKVEEYTYEQLTAMGYKIPDCSNPSPKIKGRLVKFKQDHSVH